MRDNVDSNYIAVMLGLLLGAAGCGDKASNPPAAPWDDEEESIRSRDDDDDGDDDDAEDDTGAGEDKPDTESDASDDDDDDDDDGSGGDAPDEDPKLSRYVVPFVPMVGDLPLLCGQKYTGVGTSDSTIEVRDFRFYVHDVELVDAEGASTPLTIESDSAFHLAYEKADGEKGGLVLLDFTDTSSNVCNERGTPHTNFGISGTAPEGDYERIRFKLGVPKELNHIEGAKAAAPLNAYGMQWSWASGYRYMKADILAVTGDVVKDKYYMHSGAAGCAADDGTISGSYDCDNRLISEVEIPLELGKEAVKADLATLYAQMDLSLGRGCMGTSSLRDFADGPPGADYAGCTPMYASVGLALSQTLTRVEESMGTCEASPSTSCRVDDDCESGDVCAGYVAAADPVPAEQSAQAMFSSTEEKGDPVDPARLPDVSELSDESSEGWPHPDYVRDPELDVSAISEAGGRESHPKGDPRFGSNCMSCHQAQGPGPSQYLVAGTVHTADEAIFDEGGVIAIGTGIPNRFGPKQNPIHDRVADFNSLLEIPIDAFGQFYVTADMAPELNYSDENYLALVYGNQGTCKTVETGEPVLDVEGKPVRCAQAGDCAGLTYEVVGACDDGTACREDADCTAGGTCQGYSDEKAAICDKLLNAMPLATVGACNHCHGEAFRVQSTPWEN